MNELCFLSDPSLSWKAKGLLLYLLNAENPLKEGVDGLAGGAADGKDSCHAGIKELEKAGYLSRHTIRGEDGRIEGWEYQIKGVK